MPPCDLRFAHGAMQRSEALCRLLKDTTAAGMMQRFHDLHGHLQQGSPLEAFLQGQRAPWHTSIPASQRRPFRFIVWQPTHNVRVLLMAERASGRALICKIWHDTRHKGR